MGIIENLAQILNARYGRDVRQAIHDSIEEGYNIAVQAEGAATSAQNSAAASANAAAGSSAAALQSAQDAAASAAQAMSGTPEGYAALVDKVYSIYKQTASSFALLGTAEGSALARKIYGMSTQDGTPTPTSPVEIKSAKADFKVKNKNLITYLYYGNSYSDGVSFTKNDDGTITISGSSTYARYLNLTPDNFNQVLEKGTYKLKINPVNAGVKLNVQIDSTTGTLYQSITGEISFTLNERHPYKAFLSVPANTSVTSQKFEPILTIGGVTDLTFEKGQSVQQSTDITLRAIETTYANPKYNLLRDGHYYVADTLDWSEDEGFVVTRRVGHFTPTQAVTFIDRGTNKEIQVTVPKPFYGSTTFMCNRFHNQGASAVDGNMYLMNVENSNPVARLFIDTTAITSIDTGTTWLANNPTVIDFCLDTPYTEHITAEQALSLLSLKTYDVATSIDATGDVAPIVDLEFSKDENTALALSGHNEGFKAQERENLYGVKNLLPYPWRITTNVTNGITFTDNGDGTFNISGTASAGTANDFVSSSYSDSWIYLKNGTYKWVSNQIYDADVFNLNMDVYHSDGTHKNIKINETFTAKDGDYIKTMTMWVGNGKTVRTATNVTMMLCLASIQSDEYEQYAMSNYELTKKVQELQAAIDAM